MILLLSKELHAAILSYHAINVYGVNHRNGGFHNLHK